MKPLQHILFVDEPDADQSAAIARAVALADNNQADLTVLHVSEEPSFGIFADLIGKDTKVVHEQLKKLAMERLEAEWDDVSRQVARKVRIGNQFVEVIRETLEGKYDLVMKVAGSRHFLAPLAAGRDRHLIRKCPCPVWLMKGAETSNYQNIVAAVDFDPWHEVEDEGRLNQQILDLAAATALSESAALTLVHAWTPISDKMISVFASDLPPEQVTRNLERERRDREQQLRALGEALRHRIGDEGYEYISPRFHLLQGDPGDRIPAAARQLDADLVVMGTLSRTGIAGLIIGNTAETILGSLDCAVLAVKPEGFETPIRRQAFHN